MTTRLKADLSQDDIHEFMLENANIDRSEVPEEVAEEIVDVRDESETTEDSGAMAGDDEPPVQTEHQQLMTMLQTFATSINALATANSSNTTPQQADVRLFQKLEDCPSKKKDVSLESWLREVELWNDCNKVVDENYGKKYQKFIDSIRKSEESDELIAVANAEFIENVNFERAKSDTIKNMIEIFKSKLGSTEFEKATEAWLNFTNMKQKDNETVYVT